MPDNADIDACFCKWQMMPTRNISLFQRSDDAIPIDYSFLRLTTDDNGTDHRPWPTLFREHIMHTHIFCVSSGQMGVIGIFFELLLTWSVDLKLRREKWTAVLWLLGPPHGAGPKKSSFGPKSWKMCWSCFDPKLYLPSGDYHDRPSIACTRIRLSRSTKSIREEIYNYAQQDHHHNNVHVLLTNVSSWAKYDGEDSTYQTCSQLLKPCGKRNRYPNPGKSDDSAIKLAWCFAKIQIDLQWRCW